MTVDEKALRRAYNSLEFVQTEQKRIKDYSLTRDAEGGAYVFTDGLSDRIDLEKAFWRWKTNRGKTGRKHLNLQESGCYYEITPNENQKNSCGISGRDRTISDLRYCLLLRRRRDIR